MQTLMVEKSTNDTNIMVDKINNNNNTNNFSGVSQSVNGGLNHQAMVEKITNQWYKITKTMEPKISTTTIRTSPLENLKLHVLSTCVLHMLISNMLKWKLNNLECN